ncbi:MAG: 4Fe-4S binding protein [Thermodesulfobacteriota bacterium]
MQVARKIIEINEELCNGCGQCVPSCAEGAIEIRDGKAHLVAERFCDGLGACLGECPTGALRIIERLAEDFDEAAVHSHLAARKALEAPPLACACPGSQLRAFTPQPSPGPATAGSASTLGQWPVQIRLVPPKAPFLAGSDLLITADCVPVACGAFHQEFLAGRRILLGCPKLDDLASYEERFVEIFRTVPLKSVTTVIMEVPCCSGMTAAVRRALSRAGSVLPAREVVIGVDGSVRRQQGA